MNQSRTEGEAGAMLSRRPPGAGLASVSPRKHVGIGGSTCFRGGTGITCSQAVAAKAWHSVLVAICWAFVGGFAHAHGLEGEAVVLPGWQVQVESWFETGDAAGGARVEVFRGNGSLLTDGKLNDQGIWLFSYREVEPLRIVIRAGGGHRKEVQLSSEKLIRQGVCAVAACLTPSPSPVLAVALLVPVEGRVPSPAPDSVARRESGPQWTRLFIGVVALLAVATAAIQWRRSKAK